MDPITVMYLEMFGKKYELLTYNIRFSQSYNSKNGKPDDRPVADTLYLEIISDREDDFINWMLDHEEQHEGDIIFMVGTRIVKTISFSEAVLVGYNQNPGANGNGKEITEDLTISFQKIEFEDAEYERASV